MADPFPFPATVVEDRTRRRVGLSAALIGITQEPPFGSIKGFVNNLCISLRVTFLDSTHGLR